MTSRHEIAGCGGTTLAASCALAYKAAKRKGDGQVQEWAFNTMTDVKDTVVDQAKPVRVSGKRERTKRENRAAILAAAREVFAELGYGETTVRDIIRRTGLASGTFYNYFTSKEEVFEAISDESALLIRPKLREVRLNANSFDEFLRGSYRTFFEYAIEERDTFDMVRRNTGAIRVRMDTPEIVRGFDELESDVIKAIDAGLLPNLDAGYLASSMIGIAFEVADRMLLRDPIDVDGAVDFASTLFMGGVDALAKKQTG